MTLDAVVERIVDGGNLLENLGLLANITTWQTSSEVFRAWQEGAPVQGVNTANLAVYRMVDGEAVFDLLGKTGNPFMDDRFREDAYHGIVITEFFSPQGEMKEEVLSAIHAGESTTVRYSELQVKTDGCSENYGYIEFGKGNTDAEKLLFSAVYGTENPGHGKKIYLLRESVVQSKLKDRADDVVARACYLDNDQCFNAYDRGIDLHCSAVRGVHLVVPSQLQASEASLLAGHSDAPADAVLPILPGCGRR